MTKERREYLQGLSDEYDIDLGVILPIAEILGENEDYDGLINALEDIEGGYM